MSIFNATFSHSVYVACDLCFLKIEDSPLIQCKSCKIDICIYCFLDRVETETHEGTHPYTIFNCSVHLNKGETWSVLDEMFFINGIEKYGIGNWEGIAQCIGKKDLLDVESHFYTVFNITNTTKDTETIDVKTSNPYRSIVSIYMPGRRDFDVDLLNDQEENIKDIEAGETDEDTPFKEIVLDGYFDLITMRETRRYLILSRNLIDMKGIIEKNKHNSKYLDVHKYKQLMPFITLRDYNKFLEGLYIEARLKNLLKDTNPIDLTNKARLDFVLSKSEKKFCKSQKLSKKLYYRVKQKTLKLHNSDDIKKTIENEVKDRTDLIEIFIDWFTNCSWIDKEKVDV